MTQKTRTIGRREFLKATAATTVGFTIVKPQSVRGSQANSAVRLGILGVGGRGTAVGSGFVTNAGVRVTALADLFADQLEAGRKHFDELQGKAGGAPLAAAQLFRGPDCYKRILESKEVDAIQISTPPYFHPAASRGRGRGRQARVLREAGGDRRARRQARDGDRQAGGGQAEPRRGIPDPHGAADGGTGEANLGRGLGKPACGAAFYYCAHLDRPAWPTPRPTSSGCATGSATATSPATSSSSRTSTCSTCATGSCAATRRRPLATCGAQDPARRGRLQGQLQRRAHLPRRRADLVRLHAVRRARSSTRACACSGRTAAPSPTTTGGSRSPVKHTWDAGLGAARAVERSSPRRARSAAPRQGRCREAEGVRREHHRPASSTTRPLQGAESALTGMLDPQCRLHRASP